MTKVIKFLLILCGLFIMFQTLVFAADVKDKSITGFRGTFFDMVEDPWDYPGNEKKSARFIRDGLLIVENGLIKDFGDYSSLKDKYRDVEIVTFKDRIIMPGFIDGHIHFPQTRVLGAYGQHLLEWLQESIYPEETKYSDETYAREGAVKYFDDLLANGTTTTQSFLSTSSVCAEAYFDEAAKRNMRVLGGYTGIDINAPDTYIDTPEKFYEESKKLIEKYHRKGRNLYSITPRFAYGATSAELEIAGRLKKEYPDCWVNTHLAETPDETRGVLAEFPDAKDYLAVYEKFGLVGPKFSAGHSVYLSDDEFRRLSKAGAAIIFCPSSNMFLGSGLFRLGQCTDPDAKVRLGMGTDIGGGNNFSMFKVLDDGYKVGMLNNGVLMGNYDPRQRDVAQAERNKLSAYRGLYLITLGGAKALYIDEYTGNFSPGKEADFVVIDPDSGPPQMAWHQSLYGGPGAPENIDDCADKFFGLMSVGDDRNVEKTYIAGKLEYEKKH